MICRRDTREKTEVALEIWRPRQPRSWRPCRRKCWREQEHIVTAILMWHITWKSSSRSSTKSPDLSRLCGADVRNAKTRSRKSLLLPAAACLLNRNRSQIPAYVVENLRKRWYTGEEHTKIICNYSELCKYRQIFVECWHS